MKKINVSSTCLAALCFVFCVLLLSSCDKEPIYAESAFISATKDGRNWRGEPDVSLLPGDSVRVFGMNNSDVFSFAIPLRTGLYELSGSDAGLYGHVGGDVMVSGYALSADGGVVSITRYDQQRKYLEGTFELNLTITDYWKERDPNLQGEIAIRDGKFVAFLP